MNKEETIPKRTLKTSNASKADTESLRYILEELAVIRQAITGNSLGNDGGIVGRIEDLEKENTSIKQEMRDMRDDINKFKWIGSFIFGIPTIIAVAKLLFDLVK